MKYLTDEQVLELATKAHEGQTRDNGDPYITHPIRVAAHALKAPEISFYADKSIVYQVAILHDVLEDTKETIQTLIDKGVNPLVVDYLFFLNKKNFATYTGLVLAASQHFITSIVKLADLKDNLTDTPKGTRRDKYELAGELIISKLMENA